ncbi:MAG: hypothetical protein HOC74_03035 [Gemmatimonadetes bacterium]|nr:hypothetical protein [Gemmatimonadota bacterium]
MRVKAAKNGRHSSRAFRSHWQAMNGESEKNRWIGTHGKKKAKKIPSISCQDKKLFLSYLSKHQHISIIDTQHPAPKFLVGAYFHQIPGGRECSVISANNLFAAQAV